MLHARPGPRRRTSGARSGSSPSAPSATIAGYSPELELAQARRAPESAAAPSKPWRSEPGHALTPVGQDGVGKLGVDGITFCEPPGECFAVLCERPLGALAPCPCGLLGDPAPGDERVPERFADPGRLDGAATQRNQAAALQGIERQALLGLAKARLAVGGEDLRDRLSELALDLGVHVGRRDPEDGCRALCRTGLAGPHEADERDRRCP